MSMEERRRLMLATLGEKQPVPGIPIFKHGDSSFYYGYNIGNESASESIQFVNGEVSWYQNNDNDTTETRHAVIAIAGSEGLTNNTQYRIYFQYYFTSLSATSLSSIRYFEVAIGTGGQSARTTKSLGNINTLGVITPSLNTVSEKFFTFTPSNWGAQCKNTSSTYYGITSWLDYNLRGTIRFRWIILQQQGVDY